MWLRDICHLAGVYWLYNVSQFLLWIVSILLWKLIATVMRGRSGCQHTESCYCIYCTSNFGTAKQMNGSWGILQFSVGKIIENQYFGCSNLQVFIIFGNVTSAEWNVAMILHNLWCHQYWLSEQFPFSWVSLLCWQTPVLLPLLLIGRYFSRFVFNI